MSKKKSHYRKADLVFEELEPRLLLSADPLAVATDAGTAAVEQFVSDINEDHGALVQTTNERAISSVRTELVIIDSRAPNYQQLHNDLIKAQQQGRNIHVVVLDAHRDGIEQINEVLASHDKLDAMHIVSHGDDGQLQLGSTQLNKTTLRDHASDIGQWKDRFTDDGDLLIYGCNLAETAEGKTMVDALSYLTATDVAASDDLTGNKLLGGDWELEYEAGDIESSIAFSEDVQQNWQGTLEGAAPAAAEQQQAAEEQQQQEQQTQVGLEQQQPAINEEEQGAISKEEEQQASIAEEQRQEVVFIDESVSDFQTLIDDLQVNSNGSTTFEMIFLDSDRNGIDQINETLSGYSEVDALHVISHGYDGTVKLGNTWLSVDNLEQHSDSLAAWSGSLTQDADILIYGCKLAESMQGEQFVAELAQLTGADVAASNDITGHASLGGDWDLEYKAGVVETEIAFSEDARQSWASILNTFVVTSTADSGVGSLRQAILDANSNVNSGTPDLITFNISGAGPHIINLTSALPTITETVIIDGSTEPDYAGNPVVRIDGASAGAGANGFRFAAASDNSVVRGLMITGFPGFGIQVDAGADGITIANNWIGTTGTGSTGVGNSNSGINIQGANTIVGGTGANDGNVITNNANEGINVTGAGATGTIIQGNIIGLDPDGSTGSGNTDVGIALLSGSHNSIIGGTTTAARNLISNNFEGIEINSNNNLVQGNYIGTDAGGTLDRGNRSDDGVEIQSGATGNLIGGTVAGAGNLIAFNARDGVYLVNGTGNSVLGNQIHSNTGLGIDLGSNGVNANDANDVDTGANNLQNFPVLTDADTNTVDTIVIDGTLNSTANSYFRIEFFASNAADGTGYGEGETYLGFVNVATDGGGNASFSAALSATVANGAVISATATRSDATYTTFTDTSEFAANINAMANYAPGASDDPLAYNNYLTSLGPDGYWRMGEAAGVTASDDGGTGNTGTYNGVTLGQTGAIAGDLNTAVSFDGIDDYLEIPHDNSYLLDNGSVQFWFNTANVTQRADLFSKDALGNVTGGHLSIYLDGAGNIETRLQSASADYFTTSTLPLTNNQWHHVAFTFGADGMQLYVDGQLQDSDIYTGGLGTTSGGAGNYEPIAIGASTQTSGTGSATPLQDYFSGYMDEVALFGTALSANQIQNLYAGGVQNYTVAEDNTLNVAAAEGVLINDYDQEGDSLTAMLVSGPSNAASFTLYNDGSFDYTPVTNFSGTDSFTYMAHDGTSSSNVATVTITITGDNDAPFNTIPGIQTVLEDTQTAIAGISVADPDAGAAQITTQLSVSNGVLDVTLAGAATISAGANGSNSLTISGNITDINATLASLLYTGNANVNGIAADTLTIVTDDLGNAGTGGALNDSDNVQIDITAINDAPAARDDRIGLVFDGVDDYVTIGDYVGLNVTTNLTMEAWIKPTGLGTGSKIIINKEGEYEMAINATTGELMWAFDNLDPDWSWHYTGYFVQPDEWTHVAVSYNNGVVETYANGALVDSYTGSGEITDNYPVFNQLQIGGRENAVTQRFDGQIDEVRLWNTTRTQLEIQTSMGALLAGVEPGLIGNWRFDEGNGITVEDRSVFGHHGTLADGINAAEMPSWQGYVVSEEATLNVSAVNGALANDFDIDADPLTAVLVSGPASAAVFILNPDGSFTYTPTANFNGVDSFSYRANDGSVDSNIATVTIRVDPVNDVPVATANTVVTTEENAYSFSAADFTFTDVEGDALVSATITNLLLGGGTLTYSGGMTVSSGDTLVAAQLDTLVYTPASNANGTPLATFDFTVNDAGIGVTAAQMSINVTAANDVPVAIASTVSTTEDNAYSFSTVDFTYFDTEGDALVSATITNLFLSSGTLTHSGGTTVNSGDTLSAAELNTLVYTPASNANGTPLATFDFTVNDAGIGVTAAQMSINVTAANDVPVAIASTVSTTEDNAYSFSTVDFTYFDTEGDALASATITNLFLAGGTLTHSGGTTVSSGDTLLAAELNTLVYTPASNANGTPLATFDFTVNDAGLGISGAQMSINVMPQPDAAIIGGVDSGAVTEDDDPDTNNLLEVSGALSIIDPDAGEAMFNAGAIGGSYGVITMNAAGNWGYAAINSQPAIQNLAAGATLTDTITVSSVDGTTHDIVITIMGTNDAPVAGNDVASVNEGGSVLIAVAATDNDIDNALDLNSIVITGLPANGSVVVNGDGTVTYTHDGSETLVDSFSYTISDISGAVSNTATVTLSINSVNDMPTTSGITDVSVNEDAASTNIDLNAAFADSDNLDSELSYSIIGNSNIGLFAATGIDNATGQLTLDYAADMNGAAQISIRASDPSGSFVDTLFSVNVAPVNDNPMLQANTGVLTTGTGPATISNAELNVTDIDNLDSELVYTITELPAHGDLMRNGVVMTVNDTFTQAELDSNLVVYTAKAAMVADRFGFTVSDTAGGALANNTFNIIVQLNQDNDDGSTSEPPPGDTQEEEDTREQDNGNTDSGGSSAGAGGYGGGFVPFGGSSAPPAEAPAPVLTIDPPPQPVEEQKPPVETEEYVAAEVEQKEVTTFTAVQVKSIDALWSAIDKMKQEMAESADESTSMVEFQVAAAKSSGVVLTAGVVAWILRSGALLSSLMSTIPLWKGYDPLPILAYKDDDKDNKEEDIDEHKIPTSLEDLRKLKKLMQQQQKRADEVDVDSMFGDSPIREE